MMKKGDELILEAIDLKKLGVADAVIKDEACNRNVEIKNVIPGQTVKGRVKRKRKNKVEATLTEILERSALERRTPCAINDRCGGCLYATLDYETELDLKKEYLKKLFPDYKTLYPSPESSGYRNKMEYTFGNEIVDGPLTLGLHERNRYYNILNTPECLLPGEDFNKIREAVCSFFDGRSETFYHKNTHHGFLRHLVLRRGENTGEILVNLVTSSEGELDDDAFVKMLLGLELDGEITGILHTLNDSPADAVIAEKVECLYGNENFTENLLGLTFEITPFSFFQVNSHGAERLYSIVRDLSERALGDTENPIIYDLYSGTGTITQILSKPGAKVVGIELNPEAVRIARENAVRNGVEAEFIAGDVLETVKDLKERPDLIVLDPPRSGIHPKALPKILEFSPDYFIYVSCSPESLKVDLPQFLDRGYTVEEMCGVDMFPRTPHVETVVLLRNEKAIDNSDSNPALGVFHGDGDE